MKLPTESSADANAPRDQKEWTLMFYFASDNPLAPGIVQQLKAIKNAGFHQEVNVVAQFDPEIKDIPTHFFDVNRVNKLENPGMKHDIGFQSSGPFIRNLLLDKLWDQKENDEGISISEKLASILKQRPRPINFRPPQPPFQFESEASNGHKPEAGGVIQAAARKPAAAHDAVDEDLADPLESLRIYLDFCAREYPARHYMLFILGHGLVVGNDMFLYDEHAARPSLRLNELGTVLNGFKTSIGAEASNAGRAAGQVELISLHSCSMSSAEVVYEIQGTARFLLASQGPAFVGSWPYREILLKVFTDQVKRETRAKDAPTFAATVNHIFDFIYYTSYDFQMAGYPFDLSLCHLDKGVPAMTRAINTLSDALIAGLQDKKSMAAEFILLAHWEAQSFWNESYTDLCDFCSCLKQRCEGFLEQLDGVNAETIVATKTGLRKIVDACKAVMRNLKGRDALVCRSNFVGPQCQYSNGLSVYFPWAEPANSFWKNEYPAYAFAQQTKWAVFLQTYFDETKRKPVFGKGQKLSLERELLEEVQIQISPEKVFGIGATLGPPFNPADKPGGDAATGMAGDGAVIKNYPSHTRERVRRDPKCAPNDAPMDVPTDIARIEVRSLDVEMV